MKQHGYLVNIFETIDGTPYDYIDETKIQTIINNQNAPKGYAISFSIEHYSKEGETTKDIIKIIEINIKYKIGDTEQTIGAKHLKVKE